VRETRPKPGRQFVEAGGRRAFDEDFRFAEIKGRWRGSSTTRDSVCDLISLCSGVVIDRPLISCGRQFAQAIGGIMGERRKLESERFGKGRYCARCGLGGRPI
jgi:hypothetical protein